MLKCVRECFVVWRTEEEEEEEERNPAVETIFTNGRYKFPMKRATTCNRLVHSRASYGCTSKLINHVNESWYKRQTYAPAVARSMCITCPRWLMVRASTFLHLSRARETDKLSTFERKIRLKNFIFNRVASSGLHVTGFSIIAAKTVVETSFSFLCAIEYANNIRDDR